MNTRIFMMSFMFVVVMVTLSGCATKQDSQQNSTQSINQNNGPTVSGYIDIGGAKRY